MADHQHSDESSEPTRMENQRSDEHVAATNVVVGSSESPDQHSDKDMSIADVALESLKSKDEGESTSNVSVVSSESKDKGSNADHVAVGSLDSDKDMSIADVALESLKSKDEGAITTNVSVENLESTEKGSSADHVAIGSSESADLHSDKDLNIADVALESLKSKDKGSSAESTDKGSSAAGSLESTNQHSNYDLSIADVALESLKSNGVATSEADKVLSTDHFVVGSLESSGAVNQHSDEGTSIADVALESLKSKGVEDKHSDEAISKSTDKGSSTDHVAVGSLEPSGVTNLHSDEGASIADVALESLKSKGVVDEASLESTDKGLSTDHVVLGNLEPSGGTNLHSDEGVSMADIALESLKSKGVTDKLPDEGAITTNPTVGSLEPTDIAIQHSDKDLSTANVAITSSGSRGLPTQQDVALESLKSKDFADKHSDENAVTTNVTVENTKSMGSGSTVEINIKTLDSQLHNFNVDKNMSVSVFKKKIATEVGLPVEQQRLIFRGKALKDEDPLSEYQIESGNTLHLVDRQPSELQVSSGSPNTDTTARSIDAGQNDNVTGTHPRAGHVSHSVVLGTVGAGDQNEAGNQDISQVIGAVLNSFGIAGQPPTGGIAQPNMQFSIPVQVGQGNETGNQSEPRSPSQSMAQGFQTPLGSAPAIPTLATPIPDSLNTLSEFMTHMERALFQNGYQPSNSTERLPPIELPSNAGGLPSPAALAVVLRHAQRLLSGPTVDSISHTARNLDEEEKSTDVTVRTRIQTAAMQSGLAMQHLGVLLLELGRTMLTLRIGQSHAESSVNAGPAVYISPSGPNPIMVQPFPLQTNSLFGDHATPAANSGPFGPVGVGSIPRNLNIHIHAGVGPRTTNVESNQGELANGNVGVNSQSRSGDDNTRSGNQAFRGQAPDSLPEVRTDARGMGNATSSSARMRSVSEPEGGPASSRSNAPVAPMGLGSGGLQQKRRHRQTRSEAGSSSASTSYANQSLTPSGGQMDPASMWNQVRQTTALSGLLAGVSNHPGAGSPDFMRNLMTQVAQNPGMMNTVTQFAQQMDGNQDLAGMMAVMGGSAGSGNHDISTMVQQMMPFVSQTLNRGSSSSNLSQSVPPRKGTLHRRSSSVKSAKSLNVKEKSSAFQMNLENAAQKIVEQYPPIEIFSSVVETAAVLHNNVFDTAALDELCMQEEIAQEFYEMLKRDIARRLQGGRR